MTTGQTLTQRTRAQLESDTSAEFTVSRTALETLALDSERYASVNGALNSCLVSARARLKDVGYSYDGEMVWGRVVERLETVAAGKRITL